MISPTELCTKVQSSEKDTMFSICSLIHGEIFAITNIPRNLPITININSGKIGLLMDLENYAPDFAPDMMLGDEDNIYVLELSGHRLMHVSMLDRKIQYYQINCHKEDWGNFAAFVQYRNTLYAFPTYLDKMVKISFKSQNAQLAWREYPINKKNKESIKQEDDLEYFICGCQMGDKVWLFQRKGRLAVSYNMESGTWEQYEMPLEINDCAHTISYGEQIYILNAEGKVYAFEPQGMCLDEIADCSDEKADGGAFSRLAVTDKNIYLLPSLGSDIFILDINTREVKRYESYPEGFKYCAPEGWSKFHGYCEDEDHYYYAMRSMNFFLAINKRSGKERWIKLNFPTSRQYQDLYIKYNRSMLQESLCSMKEVLDSLKHPILDSENIGSTVAGVKIWEQMSLD